MGNKKNCDERQAIKHVKSQGYRSKLVSKFTRFQTGVQDLTSPLGRYESAASDGRRICFFIGVIFAVAFYLFVEEVNRRSRLANLVFYDEVLHAMDHMTKNNSLSIDEYDTNINQASLAEDSLLLKRLLDKEEPNRVKIMQVDKGKPLDTDTSAVTSAVRSCEPAYYVLKVKESLILGAGTDRESSMWTLSGTQWLLEFGISCNILSQGRVIYALVGRSAKQNTEQTDNLPFGVFYDWHDATGPKLFYRTRSAFRNEMLRRARNITGRYYEPKDYRKAIIELLTMTTGVPRVIGMALPVKSLVLVLPVALFLLTFAFYHRARRIQNHRNTAWVIVSPQRIIETVATVVWKGIILAANFMVYLTASLYVSASAELQGDTIYLDQQQYSTELVSLFNLDLWVPGIWSFYLIPTCLFSLLLTGLGLVALRKTEKSDELRI